MQQAYNNQTISYPYTRTSFQCKYPMHISGLSNTLIMDSCCWTGCRSVMENLSGGIG